MLSLLTNVAAMQALRARSAAGRELAEVRERISTGLRVGSARDDGASWSIARNLRSEIVGWNVVAERLGAGEAIGATASEGVRAISENLIAIRQRVLMLAEPRSAEDVNAIHADIKALVAQNDRIARASTFSGVNLLTTAPPPPQPPDFGLALPSGPGSGPYSFSRNGGPNAGRVVFDFELYGASDTVEVWHDGVRVAATGQPAQYGGAPVDPALPATYSQTLAFDYSPGGSGAIDFRFNQDGGGSGWLLTGLRLDPLDSSAGGGAGGSAEGVDIVSTPGGGSTRLESRSMLSDVLGTDDLTTEPVAVALAKTEAALQKVSDAAAYFGGKQSEFEDRRRFVGLMIDQLTAGEGDLLDAALARESARLQALQVREQLTTSALSIAGGQMRLLLALFPPN